MPSAQQTSQQPPASALSAIWTGLGGDAKWLARAAETGEGALPSAFAVSDFASASIASAGLALAELVATTSGHMSEVVVNRRLASLWFGTSLKPDGWTVPPAWDAVAGDYRGRNGWIRLHTNAPHHRESALSALGVAADKAAVTAAVARFDIEELETAIVENGGCAAAMRDIASWHQYPQGSAVAQEPLLHRLDGLASTSADRLLSPTQPLAGLKVLDLTRVLAGPVATRFLASAGADVLRLDPLWWDEPGVLPEVTLGKRRARLDIKTPDGLEQLIRLLAQADIVVHGYRADALERLGLDADTRQNIRPGLIDVSLDAYGWTGPWRSRRGFDSLVQMSSGIAAQGMRHYATEAPKPLPVQALDHATGYIMAAAAIRGITSRAMSGKGSIWRTSLARMAHLLIDLPMHQHQPDITGSTMADFGEIKELTGWGPAWRLKNPLAIPLIDLSWHWPAGPLGTDQPTWEGGNAA